MGYENVPRCQHVKVNGVQCGSPALRRKIHCFFHERVQYERELAAENKSGERTFGFPLLEDGTSIQVALMKIIQMLGSGILDHKTGGLMLYALQTASANLRHAKFEPEERTDVIIDQDTLDLTRIGGPQWSSRDFDESKSEASLLAGKQTAQPAPQPGAIDKQPDAIIKKNAPIVGETFADVALRRDQKRKLPERPEAHGDSLARILLDRLGIPSGEEETAEEKA